MGLPVDDDLIARFEEMLGAPPPTGQKEQVVQTFLEENSVLIPTPNLENHGLHFDAIFSKYPLSTALTTDYAYLTKSSSRWVITFVELETPEKPIFTGDMDRPTFSAQFNAAVGQVEQWMNYAEEHRDAVKDAFAKFMFHMAGNKVAFEYQLIIGRSATKNLSAEHKAAFEKKCDNSGMQIMTYDGLISFYRSQQRAEKHILALTKTRFRFKKMADDMGSIFSYLGPDTLNISAEQLAELSARGYDMDAWSEGRLLTHNGKWPYTNMKDAMARMKGAAGASDPA